MYAGNDTEIYSAHHHQECKFSIGCERGRIRTITVLAAFADIYLRFEF